MQTLTKTQKYTHAENLPFKRCPNSYILTPEEAREIIVRPAEDYGQGEGYQRKQRNFKVRDMVIDLETAPIHSSPYGPVYVALVNGVLECVDGQHRLAAHIEAGKEIRVFIVNMDNSGAREVFVRDNGNSTKSSNIENSRASNSVKSVFLQNLEAAFDVSRHQTIALMNGLSQANKVGKFGRDDRFSIEQEEAAQMILSVWTKSDLWKFVEKANNVKISASGNKQPYPASDAYTSKVVLEALGRLVRSKKYDLKISKKLVQIVKDADWKKETKRSLRFISTETGSIGARLMLDFIKADILANQI